MKFLNFLNNVLFPSNLKCVCCNHELQNNEFNNICKNCLTKMNFILNPCPTCGDNMVNENTYCLNCKNRKSTYFTRSRSVFVYSGIAKSLVINAKFNGRRYLSKTMSAFMVDCYKSNRYNCDIVTYVPSGTRRIKERGFNLTKLLAEEVAKSLEIPVINTMERIKESHQIDKNFKSRQDNIKDAFRIIKNIDIKNKTILLIDDVYTTGATMNECSRILTKAGAKAVFGLTFAHTRKVLQSEANQNVIAELTNK